VNMVFESPEEFRAPDYEVAEMALGAKLASFEKPEKLGHHMKPLFVKGYVEGKLLQRIMVDGGTRVNVMLITTSDKLGFKESELMKTNTSLSAFTGDVMEAKGVMSVELTIGSKTMATAFIVLGVKRCYNLLLGHDWIHANGCVPSTLHQCLVQWIGDELEVVSADNLECVAAADARVDDGDMICLSRKDLSKYDYISVSRDGLIPISVKPMSMTRLNNMGE
jgi:hypothetical protein